jgi:hypothetical protein
MTSRYRFSGQRAFMPRTSMPIILLVEVLWTCRASLFTLFVDLTRGNGSRSRLGIR